MRTETTRAQIHSLQDARPFRPFVIMLENGTRVLIEHPENIAYDPKEGGWVDLFIITGRVRLLTTFDAVTGAYKPDEGGEVNAA